MRRFRRRRGGRGRRGLRWGWLMLLFLLLLGVKAYDKLRESLNSNITTINGYNITTADALVGAVVVMGLLTGPMRWIAMGALIVSAWGMMIANAIQGIFPQTQPAGNTIA